MAADSYLSIRATQAGGALPVPPTNCEVTLNTDAIGFLSTPARGVYTLPAAATTNAQAITLANACRALLISFGLAQ